MPSDPPASTDIAVAFTSDFKRNVRQLAMKYWRIKFDVQPVIERLKHGETPGDLILVSVKTTSSSKSASETPTARRASAEDIK